MQLRRNQRVGRERGAVAVEYALGVALILLVTIGAIQSLQSSGSTRLAARGGAIGTPDLPGASPTTTTTTTTTTPATTTTAPPATPVRSSGIAGVSTDLNGNNWSATAVVTVVDGSGQPVGGVTVTGLWVDGFGGRGETTCTSQADGTCTLLRTGLKKNQEDWAEFSLTTLSGTGYTYTPDPADQTSVRICRPGLTAC